MPRKRTTPIEVIRILQTGQPRNEPLTKWPQGVVFVDSGADVTLIYNKPNEPVKRPCILLVEFESDLCNHADCDCEKYADWIIVKDTRDSYPFIADEKIPKTEAELCRRVYLAAIKLKQLSLKQ